MSTTGSVVKNDIIDVIAEVSITSTINDKKVYGIYVGTEEINDSNSNTSITQHKLAALGEGTLLVTNINGDIENGDYITTSLITGYGMKQDDDLLHNYTVAKCLETVDWDSINETITYNGTSYKKYSIACTYHCG